MIFYIFLFRSTPINGTIGQTPPRKQRCRRYWCPFLKHLVPEYKIHCFVVVVEKTSENNLSISFKQIIPIPINIRRIQSDYAREYTLKMFRAPVRYFGQRTQRPLKSFQTLCSLLNSLNKIGTNCKLAEINISINYRDYKGHLRVSEYLNDKHPSHRGAYLLPSTAALISTFRIA